MSDAKHPAPHLGQPVPQPVPLAIQRPLPQQIAPMQMQVTPGTHSETPPEKVFVISDWAMF